MSDAPLIIRPMTTADLDDVLLLEVASFANPWSREIYAHELHDNKLSRYRVVVSVDPGEDAPSIVAHGGWMLFGEEAHILTIAVRPEFRRRSIGRWLLLHLLAEARGEGCASVVLEVRPSNTAARRLYEGMGFSIIGQRKRYYPDKEDALVLMLEGLRDARVWGSLTGELGRLAQSIGRRE